MVGAIGGLSRERRRDRQVSQSGVGGTVSLIPARGGLYLTSGPLARPADHRKASVGEVLSSRSTTEPSAMAASSPRWPGSLMTGKRGWPAVWPTRAWGWWQSPTA